jgi:hypothetical protein
MIADEKFKILQLKGLERARGAIENNGVVNGNVLTREELNSLLGSNP